MRSFLVVLFIFLQLSLLSQNKRVDSLQIVLDETKGKEKSLVLNELAIEYWSINPSKSIQLATNALDVEKKYKYFEPQARTYNIIGVAYMYLNDSKKADEYFSKCILTAEKYGSEKDIQKALINKLHLVDSGFKEDTLALEKSIKKQLSKKTDKDIVSFMDLLLMYVASYSINSGPDSKKCLLYTDNLLKNTTDKDYQAAIILAQGCIYKIKKDHFVAINYFKKAINLANNSYVKYSALINVGNIYFETHKYEESIYFFEEALEMIKKEKSINLIDGKHYYVCACLGTSYLELKKYELALSNLRFASNSPFLLNIDVIGINNNIGYALMSLDSLKSAEIFINKAYNSCIDENADIKVAVLNTMALFLMKTHQDGRLKDVIAKISLMVDSVTGNYIKYDNYKLLGDYYESVGDYKKSNAFIRKSIGIKDLIRDEEFQNKLSEFEAQYETDKLRQVLSIQKINIKEKNTIFILLIIGGLLLVSLLIAIIFLYNKQNKAYKQLVLQSLETSPNKNGVIYHKDVNSYLNNNNHKSGKSTLDPSVKQQILQDLDNQLKAKIFFDNGLTLDLLADKCHTNRSYLSQIINEVFHTNFNSFINTLRVSEAKKMMMDLDAVIPLKELYKKLGFNSYSVFNEAFKKSTGVTPAFYLDTLKEHAEQIKNKKVSE